MAKKKKSLLEKYRDEKQRDNTKRNLKALKKLSSMKLDRDLGHNLLDRLTKNTNKETPANEETTAAKSVFTEDDFKKFVKQYLVD